MVLTRTGKGSAINIMPDQTMDELKDQIKRLSTRSTASENENKILRKQLDEIREQNKKLIERIESSIDETSRRSKVTQTNGSQTSPHHPNPNSGTSTGQNNRNNEGNNTDDATGNINMELVNGILSHFETLNISVPLPSYDGQTGNPVQFIEKLEKYFLRKRTRTEQKLLIVEDALKGRARIWHEARFNPFISFEHFKTAFLNEFYSLEARIKSKTEWASKRFKVSDGSLLEYFNEQVRAAKYISPRLDDYEVHYTIIKQLPQRARDALAAVEYSDYEKISKALARLDASHNENYSSVNYGRSAAHQGQQRSANPQVNYLHRSSSFKRQNNQYTHQDRRDYPQTRQHENWREQADADRNKYFAMPDVTQPPPNARSLTHNTNNNNTVYEDRETRANNSQNQYTIRALQSSEFIADLCWDVEAVEENDVRSDARVTNPRSENGEKNTHSNTRIVSPRCQANIAGKNVSVLIDSGSDITCVSQQFYEELAKTGVNIPELPVSNLAVCVAVSRKSVGIRKKVYLSARYGKFDIDYTYLVVPGLSADVIVGADFLAKNGGIIDFKNEAFEIRGERIPDGLISYRSELHANNNGDSASYYSMHLRLIETGENNCIQHNGAIFGISSMGGANRGTRLENVSSVNARGSESETIDNQEPYDVVADIDKYVQTLNDLSFEERVIVREMFIKNRTVFSDKPGLLKGFEHKIRIIKEKPFVRRSQPVPLHQRSELDEEIRKMERMGIIRRANSEYCNPTRVVKKKDGKLRPVLDARWVNEIIAANHEAPPRMEELLLKQAGVKFLSTTDLVKGYWQVPLCEGSKKYTAFVHNGHMYEYNVLPFGVKDSGAAFIKALDVAIGPGFDEFVSAYIDDLLITSHTFQEHVEHLDRLFSRLREKGLTLSLEKSRFFRDSVPFLGFRLTREGIMPDPDRLQALNDLEAPTDKKQLQSVLGVVGYYRRFAVKHAYYIEPFRDLLGDTRVWNWTEKHEIAFRELKENFMNCVVLSHYIPGEIFRVQTDASDIGIAGILYMLDGDGNPRIISLVSRVLTKYERNYTVTEKELLAVIYSVLKFRYYLVGAKFQILTDHKNLTFLSSSPFSSARLMRWTLCLQEYDFEINHCKGKDNIVADFFSRNLRGERLAEYPNLLIWNCVKEASRGELRASDEFVTIRAIKALTTKPELVNELKKMKERQRADEYINRLLHENKSKEIVLREENEIVYVKNKSDDAWKLFLPVALVLLTIRCTHEQFGHAGAYKLFKYLSQFFYWRGMRRDVKSFTRSCDVCQRVKYLNHKMEGEYQFLRASKPNELISVDFFGPLPRSIGGVQYLFVIQDVFSKLLTIYPIKRATTQICLTKLRTHYFEKVGRPERVLSDHGTQFTSHAWRDTLESLGMRVIFSSIRHPQSNPVERSMREIGRILRTYCSDKHTKWAQYVKFVEDCANMTVHQSTGYAPYHLHYNKMPREKLEELFPVLRRVPSDHEVHIKRAKDSLEKAFESRCKAQKSVSRVLLNVGDEVLLRVPHLSDAMQKEISKFFHIYEGPYKIASKIGENAYRLVSVEDESIEKGTYNRFNLRKYWRSPNAAP